MAVDIFLQIPKIPGESTDAKFTGAIDVALWTWGLTQTGGAGLGTGSGTGKVNFQDLTLTKFVDKATPPLMAACASGTVYGPVVLSMRKAGATPLVYMVITLGNVTISKHNHATSSTDDRQTEEIGLHFGTVKMEYTPQNADGSGGATITTTWNVPGNSPTI
jgi:type VI secretion system secreted protein Hcp